MSQTEAAAALHDANGTLIDAAWMEKVLGCRVRAVTPRALYQQDHSTVYSIAIEYEDTSTAASRPDSVLVKQMFLPELMQRLTRSELKLLRDCESYNNECTVVQHICLQLHAAGDSRAVLLLFIVGESRCTGIRVPKPYSVIANFERDAMPESKFMICLEHLQHHCHHSPVPQHYLPTVLRWLARFHAHYYGHRTESLSELELWAVGGHWTMDKRRRFASKTEVQDLPGKFVELCEAFAETDPSFYGESATQCIGERLARHAEVLCSMLVSACIGIAGARML